MTLSWACALAVLVAVSGCAGDAAVKSSAAPRERRATFARTGISITVPAGWHTAARLTTLSEPRERFTIASYPLRIATRANRDCGPTLAVERIPPDGALAFAFEYADNRGARVRAFPDRPAHFGMPIVPAASYDCFPRGWLVRFRERGRAFQIMIALGPRSGRNRAVLLRALDSIKIDATGNEG